MEVNADTLLVNAMKDGIREGIKSKLTQSYSNPFDDVIKRTLSEHEAEIRQMLSEALASCVKDQEFRKLVATSVRHTMARTLVARFGGELEKQINVLKSDPSTRARITLAIEEIVKTKMES